MYVGVILSAGIPNVCKKRIPHVCGGDPSFSLYISCSSLVFPMYVGVILNSIIKRLYSACIPHVCGGDPRLHQCGHKFVQYSPCMWG